MIAATRSFPARNTGLVIALPCAIFGLSPLFLSNLARFFTATGPSPELDPARWLFFLAAFIGAANVVGAVGFKVTPWEEEEGEGDGLEGERVEGGGGLERSVTRPPGYDVGCGASEESLCEVDGVPDERSALLVKPAGAEAATEETQSLGQLITSPPFWIFGLVFLLATGPCEMVMASLGGIIEAILGVRTLPAVTPATATATSSSARLPLLLLSALSGTPTDGRGLALRRLHVQVISVANTLSRLLIGAVSDYLSPHSSTPPLAPPATKTWQRLLRLPSSRPHLSRLAFLLLACALLSASFLLSAFLLSTPARLWLLTLSVGFAYGTAFTSAPAVVRAVWPASAFGRNWGLLSWFSAAGAGVFTPVFGWMVDRVGRRQGGGGAGAVGREAFEGVFVVAGVSCAVAAGLVGVLWRGYWRGKV